jgi:hypothetical protein
VPIGKVELGVAGGCFIEQDAVVGRIREVPGNDVRERCLPSALSGDRLEVRLELGRDLVVNARAFAEYRREAQLLVLHLADIPRMIRLSALILPPCAAIGKPGPSSLGLPGAQVGDGSAFQARNVDLAFIRTHLSLGFRSSARIGEPFMPVLDQAAPAVPHQTSQHRGSLCRLPPSARPLGGAVERRHATGHVRLVRYADDYLLMFQRR